MLNIYITALAIFDTCFLIISISFSFCFRKSDNEISTCTNSGRKVPLDPEFHFFSDTELTTGQEDSRPNTPIHLESVQSDTEFEVKKSKGKLVGNKYFD